MKKTVRLLGIVTLGLLLSLPCYAQEWARMYWEIEDQDLKAIEQTTDGSYIVTGINRVNSSRGNTWILKLNPDGSVVWQKEYGEVSAFECGYSVHQTSDGGFVVAGHKSSEGSPAPRSDLWVMKLNLDGSVVWQKRYGQPDDIEHADSIVETIDEFGTPDGYIVAGNITAPSTSSHHLWVLKLDLNGDVVWQNIYGSSDLDPGCQVQQTADGGYILAGEIYATTTDDWDLWILKLNSDGSVGWQKHYGGPNADYFSSVYETTDVLGNPNGYIVAGFTNSFGAGDQDLWVIKLDLNGSWQKTYGRAGKDTGSCIKQTSDGNYVVLGTTAASGGMPPPPEDMLILKLNTDGTVAWNKTYATGYSDREFQTGSIIQTDDGGYAITGAIHEYLAEDDAIVFKLDASGEIPSCNMMSTITVTVTDTLATVSDTSEVPQASSVVPTNTTIPPNNTSAAITDLCNDILPTADFSGNPTSGDKPLEVTFTDQSIPVGEIDSWSWDFDNNGTIDSNEENPTYIYNNTGIYTIKLLVAGPNGMDQERKVNYITINDPVPIADFYAFPTSGSEPLQVHFTDTSWPTGDMQSWSWDFDDDGTIDSILQNPFYTYNSAGTYTVTLTVTSPGGTDAETKTDYIHVEAQPELPNISNISPGQQEASVPNSPAVMNWLNNALGYTCPNCIQTVRYGRVRVFGDTFGPSRLTGDQVRIGDYRSFAPAALQYDTDADPYTVETVYGGVSLYIGPWGDDMIGIYLYPESGQILRALYGPDLGIDLHWLDTWLGLWVVKDNDGQPVASNVQPIKVLTPLPD
jgi:uncharacterized delta-60 repeat protein